HAIGPLAQLELERADNAQLIEAVISTERYAQLGLTQGEMLLVRPKRLRVFVDHAA
ncbi:MAG TPA: TOBE-like domain-containing protein, partial [Noviherbaspirillum sp.]|nr:TOBE-like domain-containing protein [Noviherbaspirillum sp.]